VSDRREATVGGRRERREDMDAFEQAGQWAVEQGADRAQRSAQGIRVGQELRAVSIRPGAGQHRGYEPETQRASATVSSRARRSPNPPIWLPRYENPMW